MPGGELRDPRERGQRIGYVPQAEERRDPALIQAARKARERDERAELRAERDPVRREPVAQGLDPDAIPGQHQALRRGVPQRDRKHPPQPHDEVLAHFLV